MTSHQWDIRLEGRAWSAEEARKKHHLSPEKIEMISGKLFWSDEDRLTMLGLLVENVGAREAVRLGRPEIWRAAIAALDNPAL